MKDHPDLASRYETKQSQKLIVDSERVYRGIPEISKLTHYLDKLKSSKPESP